eukprot:5011342-Pyramimonas_sp.AAC.1
MLVLRAPGLSIAQSVERMPLYPVAWDDLDRDCLVVVGLLHGRPTESKAGRAHPCQGALSELPGAGGAALGMH